LDLITIERKRELWECENFLKGEKDEMIDIYENKGLNRETASTMVDLMSENKQAFVDVMMVQELGLKPVVDPWGPLKVIYF
jgi:vacuolar iron transporter family protein